MGKASYDNTIWKSTKKVVAFCLFLLLAESQVFGQQLNTDYDSSQFYYEKENWKKATPFLKASLALFQPWDSLYISTYAQLGFARGIYDLKKGERMLEEALEKRKELYGTDHIEVITGLTQLAGLYDEFYEFNKMKACYEEAKAINLQILGKNNITYFRIVRGLSSANLELSDVIKSRDYAKEAVEIALELYGEKGLTYAHALSTLAIVEWKMGDLEEAVSHQKKVIETNELRFGKEHIRTIMMMNNLSVFYRESGLLELAEKIALESLDLIEKQEGRSSLNYGQVVNTLAKIYIRGEQFHQAKEEILRSIMIFSQFVSKDNMELAQSKFDLSNIYLALEEYDSAMYYYSEAKNVVQKVRGDDFRMFFRLGLPMIEQAVDINLDNPEAANLIYQQEISYYLSIIRSYFNQLNEDQRNRLYKTLKDYFDSYRSFVIAYGKTNPSFLGDLYDVELETKGILLNTSLKLKNEILSSGNEVALSVYTEIQKSRQELGKVLYYNDYQKLKLGANPDSIHQVIETLEDSLRHISKEFNEYEKRVSWKDIRAVLKDDEAAIEIMRIKNFDFNRLKQEDSIIYAALIITANSDFPKMVVMEDGNGLEKKYLKAYQNAIKFKSRNTSIYEKFWAPINQSLEGTTRVFLSLDGVYNKLNIDTFRDASGLYLIDKMDIRYVSNTKVLVEETQEKHSRRYGVLVGNPLFSPEEGIDANQGALEKLPGTAEEIQGLSEIMTKANWGTDIMVAQNATEERLKSIRPPGLLHIATHGFFKEKEDDDNKSNPLFNSGLYLSNAQLALNNIALSEDHNFGPEDGILTAYEAMSLPLNGTDLVVFLHVRRV